MITIVYATKGKSAKNIAEKVFYLLKGEKQIFSLNEKKILAENLIFDYLLLVCPTYGDEELEPLMESFLIASNWLPHEGKKFSVIELGLYRGYNEVVLGAGNIIDTFLSQKRMKRHGSVLSIDSVPSPDDRLLEPWVNKYYNEGY